MFVNVYVYYSGNTSACRISLLGGVLLKVMGLTSEFQSCEIPSWLSLYQNSKLNSAFFFFNINLFKRQKYRDTSRERSSVCWFTTQMPKTARAGPGQAKARSYELLLGAGARNLGSLPLLSQVH